MRDGLGLADAIRPGVERGVGRGVGGGVGRGVGTVIEHEGRSELGAHPAHLRVGVRVRVRVGRCREI